MRMFVAYIKRLFVAYIMSFKNELLLNDSSYICHWELVLTASHPVNVHKWPGGSFPLLSDGYVHLEQVPAHAPIL